MAGPNIDVIYSRGGNVSSNDGTTMTTGMVTATADYTGASANHVLAWTANTTNGGYIQRLRFKATGTVVASVARIYINNGSVNTTATNNQFSGEQSLPAVTAINTSATSDIDYPMGFAIDPGFRIYVGLGTTVAASWIVTGVGGRY